MHHDDFPFLQLTEGQENKDLKMRLKLESREISRKFAVLVTRTEQDLIHQKITVESLMLLINGLYHSFESDCNNLIKKLSKLENTKITTAFFILSDHWSFFEYELLKSIIESFSPDLMADLNLYVTDLKLFCERRLCEVPIDALERRRLLPKDVLIKLDEVFIVPLKNIKEVTLKLSEILHTSLHLVGFKEGCIELAFICMHELDKIFPLSDQQTQKLSQTQVLKICNDKELVYYESIKSAAESLTGKN